MTTEDPINISANNDHSGCLLCGNLNPRSLKLSFHVAGNGAVETQFQAHTELQGYNGVLHGGVIAALLDAAMTHCLFHQGVQAVTGDLRVRFVRAVSCNAFLDVRAWVSYSHPPLYRLRAEIVVDKQIMARAEAKFMKRKKTR